MLQRRRDILHVDPAALFLILQFDQTGVKESAVQRPEMKLADDHRLVDALRQFKIIELPRVNVVADQVAVPGRHAHRKLRPASGKPATHVELVRRRGLELLADVLEVGVGDLQRERCEILIRAGPRPLADGEKRLPVCIRCAPRRIEFFDGAIRLLQALAEDALGRLIRRRLQCPRGQIRLAAPAQLVIHKEAETPRIFHLGLVFVHQPPHVGAERRIERIAEGPPAVMAAGDRLRLQLETIGVGRAVHQADFFVRAVGNGVHAPAPQPAVRQIGKGLVIARSVFAVTIR